MVLNLVTRTTKDVDVLALFSEDHLTSPAPLPESLIQAAQEVAEDLNLPDDWLNNGPSSGEGGLFQMGLPKEISSRITQIYSSTYLNVYAISRFDQIHFKLYASVDQGGGYHLDDLLKLEPTCEEILEASLWCRTHDPSDGFLYLLKETLHAIEFDDVIQEL